jgi:transposase
MGLSPQQIRAAELLSQGHSHQEVGNAVKVSRRTILRWLKEEDFKNLSYGLVGRASQPQPQPSQRSSERCRQSGSRLTPQDLVEDALSAVQSILIDPEARVSDKLKAASLVGDWAGLSLKKPPMHEMEGLEAMIRAGWVPNEVLEILVESAEDMEQRVKNAFYNCFENGNKKSLSQNLNPEKETFDVDVNIDDDFDELE